MSNPLSSRDTSPNPHDGTDQAPWVPADGDQGYQPPAGFALIRKEDPKPDPPRIPKGFHLVPMEKAKPEESYTVPAGFHLVPIDKAKPEETYPVPAGFHLVPIEKAKTDKDSTKNKSDRAAKRVYSYLQRKSFKEGVAIGRNQQNNGGFNGNGGGSGGFGGNNFHPYSRPTVITVPVPMQGRQIGGNGMYSGNASGYGGNAYGYGGNGQNGWSGDNGVHYY